MIILHGVAALSTAIAYFTIPVLVLYIYQKGQLKGLASTYPRLWVLGGLFIFFCGLSHLGNFIEIWIGGTIYWITGFNKLIMAIVSLAFTVALWLKSEEIILIGRALRMFSDKED
jgi:hypothetical protein